MGVGCQAKEQQAGGDWFDAARAIDVRGWQWLASCGAVQLLGLRWTVALEYACIAGMSAGMYESRFRLWRRGLGEYIDRVPRGVGQSGYSALVSIRSNGTALHGTAVFTTVANEHRVSASGGRDLHVALCVDCCLIWLRS